MSQAQLPTLAGRRPRWLVLLPLAVLVPGILAGVFAAGCRKPTPDAADPFALTPVSDSPFLNTRPEARYVGSDACRTCHEDRHATFRHTGMGRSMAPVDLGREPPDGAVAHPASGRRYQVRRKDGQLWHRELLLSDDPQEIVLAEYPLKYVIGSGRHSLTYVAEAEGFLIESPVTWFRSRQAWGMSPGYDNPHQAGFERAVGEGCLVCHAGRADAVDGSLHRMTVAEPAIGCERCHGPGSLHAERHAGRKPQSDRKGAEVDHTIVNPSRLSRELTEAICQQCHLRSNATIVARGRKPTDFRPGLPLQDFRQDYTLDVPGAAMTVTGHVDQMHQSRCYQKSTALTCLSCHDPHEQATMASGASARSEKGVAHYRAVCVGCHEPQQCKVEPRVRQMERPDNSCVHCHMPTAPTEIVHLAFTHHRIGIHRKGQEKMGKEAEERGELRPFLELTRLSDIDRRRSLGLGYLELANRAKGEAAHYRERAMDYLVGVKKEGLRDPEVDASLARLFFDLGQDGIGALAESALDQAGLEGQTRCNALYLLADDHLRGGRPNQARGTLRELVRLRRHAMDWLLLARVERALDNPETEIEALAQVVRISPRRWEMHRHLAERYRQKGDGERAAWHEQRAVAPKGK